MDPKGPSCTKRANLAVWGQGMVTPFQVFGGMAWLPPSPHPTPPPVTASYYFAPYISLRSVVSVSNKSIYVSFYIAGLSGQQPPKSLLDRMSAVEKDTNKILTLLGNPSAGKL